MANKIYIKPSKRGTLRAALGTPKGQNIPVSKLQVKSGDSAAMKKKKIFAQNARKWKKENGGKLPANTKLKDGVLFNTQGDTIRQYLPDEQRFINEPVSGYRPSALSNVLNQSRESNIRGGLVEPLPVNIPMRQQYGLSRNQESADFMSQYLPEFGFGSWLKDNAAGLLSGTGAIASAIPGIGTIAGPIMSLAGSIVGGAQAGKAAQADADAQQLLLDEQVAAQKEQQSIMDRQIRTGNIVDQKQINYGATFENGGQIGEGMMNQQPQIIDYSNGEKHGESAVGGIPVDARGNPVTTSRQSAVGLTEKGEVTWNGYVFSDKLKTK
jgi:hypothetical protein